MCAFAISACDFSARNTLNGTIDRITIEATGDNFNWYFRYPGDDGILGNSDDKFSKQNLFLPPNSNVQLKLKSKDYLYSFSLPELSLQEIAVPGLEHKVNFKTKLETVFTLLGDQFCGYAHDSLIGEARVRNKNNDFYDWDNDDFYERANDDSYTQENNDFLEWDKDDFYKGANDGSEKQSNKAFLEWDSEGLYKLDNK
jgi:heme/copper-type cytochrome/quinol oxidase subunit 2